MENNSQLKTFEKFGYEISNIINSKDLVIIKGLILEKLKLKAQVINKLEDIENYHKLVINKKVHKDAMNLENRQIELPEEILKKIINSNPIKLIMKSVWGEELNWEVFCAFSKNKKNLFEIFRRNFASFRIVKPRAETSGVHTDYFEDYPSIKGRIISMWIPLIGFTPKETLLIYPESHKKQHPKNNYLSDKYIANSFPAEYVEKFKNKRPDLSIGDILIFHPNLLHGGSINFGNKTRCSIELRLSPKSCFKENGKLLSLI